MSTSKTAKESEVKPIQQLFDEFYQFMNKRKLEEDRETNAKKVKLDDNQKTDNFWLNSPDFGPVSPNLENLTEEEINNHVNDLTEVLLKESRIASPKNDKTEIPSSSRVDNQETSSSKKPVENLEYPVLANLTSNVETGQLDESFPALLTDLVTTELQATDSKVPINFFSEEYVNNIVNKISYKVITEISNGPKKLDDSKRKGYSLKNFVSNQWKSHADTTILINSDIQTLKLNLKSCTDLLSVVVPYLQSLDTTYKSLDIRMAKIENRHN